MAEYSDPNNVRNCFLARLKDCGKVWTSISALASFALCVELEEGQPKWNLWFSLHGQTCSNCVALGCAPKPHYGTWYPHEVFRVSAFTLIVHDVGLSINPVLHIISFTKLCAFEALV